MKEEHRRIIIESIISISQDQDIKIEGKALVSTSDFRPVLTKSTVSWERSIHHRLQVKQICNRYYQEEKTRFVSPSGQAMFYLYIQSYILFSSLPRGFLVADYIKYLSYHYHLITIYSFLYFPNNES